MIISVFHNERDNVPARVETSWAQVVESLSHVTPATCVLATCARAECPHKKMRAWSPACWPAGYIREKHTVETVSCLVVDLDHVLPDTLETILERLGDLTYVLHSSHSDRDDDRCVRVVLQLSRPVPGPEFLGFWRAVIDQLGIPADERTKDAGRLYFLPSRPLDACEDVFNGDGFDYAENVGAAIDVDAVLALVQSAAPRALPPVVIPVFRGAPAPEAFTAAVQALGDAWPSRGRHPAQLALAGALTRAGWPVELVAEFCAAVAEYQEAGNGALEKRLSAARSSVEKLEGGEAVSGWPTVLQYVDPEAVDKAMAVLGLAVSPDPAFAAAMTAVTKRRGATTRLELRAALEQERDRLKKSRSLAAKLDSKLLGKILKAEPLTDHADEDREKALVQAAIAVVRAAPAGTLPETMCEFLLTPAGRLAADVEEVIALAIKHTAERVKVDEHDLPDPVDDESLREQLEMDKEGRTRGSGSNIERIVRFANDARGLLRFNLITKQVEVTSGRFDQETPSGLPIGVKNWLGSHWQLTTSTLEVADQLLRVAQRWGSYDPVAEYLHGLVWDGVPRIGTWLMTYCGVEDSSYARKVSSRFLIAACARALSPGCKVDTVLVLEGAQGVKKSSTLAILGGDWFTDTPLVMGDKDSRLLAASKWIVELGELRSLLRDDEASKGFLSQRHDDFRPPYGRAPEKFERRCVFAGSTNEVEYLQDPTGNRRYWAVRVGRCDTEALALDRDQLWAEAVYRYLSADLSPDQADTACPGERWWFPDHEQQEADDVIAQRRTEDPWVQMILTWTDNQMKQLGAQPPKSYFTMPEIAEHALHIQPADMQRNNKKIAQALREAGFESSPAPLGDGGHRRRIWSKCGVVVVATTPTEPVYNSTAPTLTGSN